MLFFWSVYKSPRLNFWNRIATSIHLIGAICMFAFGLTQDDVVYRLTHTVSRVHPTDSIVPISHGSPMRVFSDMNVFVVTEQTSHYLRLSFMLGFFFLLSFFFQSAFKSTFMRYIEYAITGSLMSVIILLQTQQHDVSVVFSVFFLHVTCMLCGALADVLHKQDMAEKRAASAETSAPFAHSTVLFGPYANTGLSFTSSRAEVAKTFKLGWVTPKWAAHFLGWLPYIVAWVIIWCALATQAQENPKMPRWVPAIVSTEFFLFNLFGITQYFHLTDHFTEEAIHLAYIAQSLLSKTILAGVLSGALYF